MKPVELAVVVSDIHCGSDVGLAPPSTFTKKGNVVGFGTNLIQEWLWERWQDGIGRVSEILGKSPAALIVNGDATEGIHHRNAADTIVADIEIHTDMAQECLRPYLKLASKVFVVAGTECHTLGMENKLAEKLKAVGGKAKDKWLIDINGCLIDAAHHTGVTSRTYLEASAMSINLGNARINYERTKQPVPNVFLRGHRHCGGYFSDGAGIYAVTGAWQFLTRHGYKVVTDSIPRPSIIVLDWRGRKRGALPTVHDITFNPPPSEITKI